MTTDIDWRPVAHRLAEEVKSTTGRPGGDQWLGAFAEVPRHEFLAPCFAHSVTDGWIPVDREDSDWLKLAYSLDSVVTHIDRRGRVLSRCSHPVALAWILQALAPQPHHRVLDLGTGTGYTAALLSHCLDHGQVFAVDLDDTDCLERAREALDRIGYRAVLAVGNAEHGLPEHAPYDRIMTTFSVSRIPIAWQEQLAPGGRIVADMKIGPLAGQLVALDKISSGTGDDARDDTELRGRFLPHFAGFMPARPADKPSLRLSDALTVHGRVTVGTTRQYPDPWTSPVMWFMAHLLQPCPLLSFGTVTDGVTNKPVRTYLAAADGSWAQIDYYADHHGHRTVTQAGPTPLWDAVEHAEQLWIQHGYPDWPRFGITVRGTEHTVWLDDPAGPHRWILPIAPPIPADPDEMVNVSPFSLP